MGSLRMTGVVPPIQARSKQRQLWLLSIKQSRTLHDGCGGPQLRAGVDECGAERC